MMLDKHNILPYQCVIEFKCNVMYYNHFRLAIKVQAGTQNCPPKAKKMKMKPNTMSAPFKQVTQTSQFAPILQEQYATNCLT